jgi:AraC family transcriptional regulator
LGSLWKRHRDLETANLGRAANLAQQTARFDRLGIPHKVWATLIAGILLATLGQSPTAFRKDPDWAAWSAQFQFISPREIHHMQVKIVTVEPVTLAVLEHRGDPMSVNDSVQRFIAWRKETGLSPITNSQTYGIAYDDPTTTPPKDFRFDICGSVTAPVPTNRHGVVTKTIPGGRCAVVRHEGSPDHIAGSIYHLYRNWLPHSGEELRDFPVYFHYLNLKSNTPEHELLTDVHLPLK